MAINEWKIWQKLGLVKIKQEKVDVAKDLNAVVSFIKDETPILRKLLDLVIEMQKFRKLEMQMKSQNATPEEMKRILKDQIKLYDEILKLYEFYELDVDVNGARIKKVANVLKKRAVKEEIDEEILNTIKTAHRWNFNW